jgi:ribosomal protein S18 acetylase RimI-like enzyme
VPVEVDRFSDRFVSGAAVLLAARHRAHRAAEPLLPERFVDVDAAAAEVAALWGSEAASGVVALRAGRVIGYLIGTRRKDAVWGANVWVEPAAHAAEDAEVVRDLYAAASGEWVEAGRTRHYVVVPASDASLVDAWFRLGFGGQHALGIREIPDVAWPPSIRRAEPRDLDALVEIHPLLVRHQNAAPVFAAAPIDDDAEGLGGDLADAIANPAFGELVAERDGQVVGLFVVAAIQLSSNHAGLARPEDATLLAWAATRPEVQGSGAGLALTNAAFAWAREQGCRVIVTDWRETNLEASRFWPARGFRRTFLRLYRSIP